MYIDFLKNTGLTDEQALLFEALLKYGAQTARSLVTRTGIKRGMAYKTLAQLEEMGLVKRTNPEGAVSIFEASHPGEVRKLAESRFMQAESLKGSLEESVGQMISDYNLMSGRPNVRFFEGKKGMEEVLDDSLYAKEEILTYADLEAIEKYIPRINEEYVRKREKLGIKKRGIVFDTPFNRRFLEGYHQTITETKLIKCGRESSVNQTVMQIYDGKVSYLTLSENNMIGVIIEDPNIYEMHKTLFEHTWHSATTI